ncbi:hypothetical protein [Legionella feeleii]|uniref:Uncharacterized protein n=1 Tax=Legionella feeleii TaxID=453 RepID=A0A0W0TMN4_9GAMM|nr:hypothetical protein [Legionella feeleii]KTC96851.1 hypothetical protein Lfee_1763 [Legionella feeleii]SPX60915.1 Uncharacterised protein [Legionella feeleii]
MRKKILTIAPVMPQQSDIESIASTLSFLEVVYQIDFIDPLAINETFSVNTSNEVYYQLWQDHLKKWLATYDAFFGFSFGGVILQQCFSLFADSKKPIVLFSTPTFADNALQKKLGDVIALCKANRVNDALISLYKEVFSPNEAPLQILPENRVMSAANRLIFGLQRVLDTDATAILEQTMVDHLHLIGECSALVNKENVLAPGIGDLCIVPQAGMRVLQDNPSYCKKLILERLNSET